MEQHDITESIVARLARMEEKLDAHLHRTATLETRLDNHDERLRAVEMGSAKLYGVGAIIAFIASVFGGSLLNVFS